MMLVRIPLHLFTSGWMLRSCLRQKYSVSSSSVVGDHYRDRRMKMLEDLSIEVWHPCL